MGIAKKLLFFYAAILKRSISVRERKLKIAALRKPMCCITYVIVVI
jgi:hypothetical protein